MGGLGCSEGDGGDDHSWSPDWALENRDEGDEDDGDCDCCGCWKMTFP